MIRYIHALSQEEVEVLQHEHQQTKGASVRRTLDGDEAEGLAGLGDKAQPGRPARVTAA